LPRKRTNRPLNEPPSSAFRDSGRLVNWFTSGMRRLSYHCQAGPNIAGRALEVAMAALVRALSRTSGTQLDVETLKTIAMFCGAGLVVSLLLATSGFDMSAGFF
jgi:hypothetical protein